MVEENKQKLERRLTEEEMTGGPNHTPEQLEKMAWFGRKQMHVDLLTPEEIKRVLKEKEDARLKREQENIEITKAREKVEKEYWSDVEKSCIDGTAEVRFARCLIRMANQNLFVTTMGSPAEKERRIIQMLRLHGIQVRDSKEKIPLTGFMSSADCFVSDPYVHKGDVVTTRRSMFPQGQPEKIE